MGYGVDRFFRELAACGLVQRLKRLFFLDIDRVCITILDGDERRLRALLCKRISKVDEGILVNVIGLAREQRRLCPITEKRRFSRSLTIKGNRFDDGCATARRIGIHSGIEGGVVPPGALIHLDVTTLANAFGLVAHHADEARDRKAHENRSGDGDTH